MIGGSHRARIATARLIANNRQNRTGEDGLSLRVAIIGAGMGGLPCAAALKRQGAEVAIYDPASAFTRLGAGIQMTPNAVKVPWLRAGSRAGALQRHHATRFPRTTAIQKRSAQNEWMRGTTDFDWVYGHDVYYEKLA
jgi:glycine/D-amino acid oxidase-like deaminating enzyme